MTNGIAYYQNILQKLQADMFVGQGRFVRVGTDFLAINYGWLAFLTVLDSDSA